MTAHVESAADPARPGRTGYRIRGATLTEVQEAIDTLSATVDAAFGGRPGYARFVGPARIERDPNVFGAIGEVVVVEAA